MEQSLDKGLEVFESIFGKVYQVFEIMDLFTNKTTGQMRRGSTHWCWAKTREDAVEFMSRGPRAINADNRYLETIEMQVNPVQLFDPNPENILDMEKGKPFEFRRDEPGIFHNKWGY